MISAKKIRIHDGEKGDLLCIRDTAESPLSFVYICEIFLNNVAVSEGFVQPEVAEAPLSILECRDEYHETWR